MGNDDATVSHNVASGEERPPPSRGFPIDHFVVIDKLGEGAMGLVMSAYDTQLDRKVAIKLLRAGGEEHAARLLREAQAMAKLAHPNVLTVYQVGVMEASVFVAMELVAGQTLGAWLRAKERSTREILEKFIAAGRGLEAAHALGLVHRDFKPDNVLVGDDGRVRVTDFGLVATMADPPAPRDPTAEGPAALGKRGAAGGKDDYRLTQTGTVLGTPRYMAPEQHLGKPVDARADQYAFSVAIYEALHGAPPYHANSYEALVAEVLAGKLPEPGRGSRTPPAWLRAIVLRGMSRDQGARFPEMTSLLAALERDPAARRRRVGAVVAAVALVGLGGFGLVRTFAPAAAPACRVGGAALAGVWDDEQRAAVRDNLLASKRSYAEDVAQRVTKTLDAYAGSWITARDQACAQVARREITAPLGDLRVACLERRRRDLEAIVRVLVDNHGPEILNVAVGVARGLPDLGDCADAAALEGALPLPGDTAVRAQIAKIRDTLADARAQARAGHFKAALHMVEPLVPESQATGWPPVFAEALLLEAEYQRATGDYRTAGITLEATAAAAARAHDDSVAARAWITRLVVLGQDQEHVNDATLLVPVAEAAVLRAGDPANLRVSLLINEAKLHEVAGRYEEAGKLYAQGLELADKRLDRDSEGRITSLLGLGLVNTMLHHPDEARRYHHLALESRLRVYGEDHPLSAVIYSRMSLAAKDEGKWEEATALAEKALQIGERTLGPDNPEVAKGMNNLANFYEHFHRYDDALAMQRRALAVKIKALGPENPSVADSLHGLAMVLQDLGRNDEARETYQKALDIQSKILGPDHIVVAETLAGLAALDAGEGKWQDAIPRLERALAISRQRLGPDRPETVDVEVQLVEVLHALGRAVEARPLVEHIAGARGQDAGPGSPEAMRAWTLQAENLLLLGRPADAVPLLTRALQVQVPALENLEVAEAEWVLARVLAARHQDGDAARSIELARKALAGFEAAGAEAGTRTAAVRAFLRNAGASAR